VGSTGSVGSVIGGDASLRERSNNTKHFTENTRLLNVQQIFSTLDERPLSEDIEDEDTFHNNTAASTRTAATIEEENFISKIQAMNGDSLSAASIRAAD
jgi:hypothetical protein